MARTVLCNIFMVLSHVVRGKWLFHDPENYVVLAVVQGKATEFRIFTPNLWNYRLQNTHTLWAEGRRTLSYKNEHSLYGINIFNKFFATSRSSTGLCHEKSNRYSTLENSAASSATTRGQENVSWLFLTVFSGFSNRMVNFINLRFYLN